MKRRSLSHLADHALIEFLVDALHARARRLGGGAGRASPRWTSASCTCPPAIPRCSSSACTSCTCPRTRRSSASAWRGWPASSPSSFEALAEGRLNLTAVLLLKPQLTPRERRGAAGRGRAQDQRPRSRFCWPSASRSRTCRLGPAIGGGRTGRTASERSRSTGRTASWEVELSAKVGARPGIPCRPLATNWP